MPLPSMLDGRPDGPVAPMIIVQVAEEHLRPVAATNSLRRSARSHNSDYAEREMMGTTPRMEGYTVAGLVVDGGVDITNVNEVVRAGADIVVMGTAFYKSDNRSELVEKVKAL